ncbi:protein kinase [Spirulina major CS-329]|uniref:protein kinase domain-containing protein n=1 Tax=Spirulina TaxID=1154 RepID=UPI00232C1B15|nr:MULTISPECIES: protein kinase [Spirulina]MDB9496571.1 protein kinase [Spirulina subsalsa CS-330]MDB9505124.1 protein kinase [Spirulina major CS-329]
MTSLNQRYSIVRTLGHSLQGLCASTLANDQITGNLVVIKDFKIPEHQQGEQWFSRYQQVCDRFQSVHSRRIVKYLHTHKTGTGFSLIRDYIPSSALDLAPQLSLREIQKIATNVLDTLIHLQQRDDGCVHANLKPSNIFVDENFTTQLTDFGSPLMTTAPMPPNDLQNLGSTLLSLLNRDPHSQKRLTTDDVTAARLSDALSATLPPQFQEWLQTLLNHDPNYHDYSLHQAKTDLEGLQWDIRAAMSHPDAAPGLLQRRLFGRLQQWLTQVRSRPANPDGILTRLGEPHWTEADFQQLLKELGEAGYGWLDPDQVRHQLELMKQRRKL